MTKAEFLKALEEKLSALSAEDRAASLAYYEEIIDDRMEVDSARRKLSQRQVP